VENTIKNVATASVGGFPAVFGGLSLTQVIQGIGQDEELLADNGESVVALLGQPNDVGREGTGRKRSEGIAENVPEKEGAERGACPPDLQGVSRKRLRCPGQRCCPRFWCAGRVDRSGRRWQAAVAVPCIKVGHAGGLGSLCQISVLGKTLRVKFGNFNSSAAPGIEQKGPEGTAAGHRE
jgi:hypothetical protein